MNPAEFLQWMAAMRAAGRASSDTEVADLLGVTRVSIQNYKRNGTDRRTALACAALLAGLDVNQVVGGFISKIETIPERQTRETREAREYLKRGDIAGRF